MARFETRDLSLCTFTLKTIGTEAGLVDYCSAIASTTRGEPQDMYAAFNTVDLAILLHRLVVSFGIDGPTLRWFRSYTTGRSQYVRCRAMISSMTQLF